MQSLLRRAARWDGARASHRTLVLNANASKGQQQERDFRWTSPALFSAAVFLACSSEPLNSHADASDSSKSAAVDVVLGAQWGDEGKGKLVDILGADYDICARVAGGSNAGHTIVVEGKKYKFHLVPSGILNPKSHCVVGHGVVVHLRGLLAELATLREANIDYKDRLHLSDRAHIVFDFHQEVDGINEQRLAGDKLGTTKKGIGPAYGSKVQRNGLRIGDLQDMPYFEAKLRTLIASLKIAYPTLEVDVEAEIAYYRSIRDEVLAMTCDTITLVHKAVPSLHYYYLYRNILSNMVLIMRRWMRRNVFLSKEPTPR